MVFEGVRKTKDQLTFQQAPSSGEILNRQFSLPNERCNLLKDVSLLKNMLLAHETSSDFRKGFALLKQPNFHCANLCYRGMYLFGHGSTSYVCSKLKSAKLTPFQKQPFWQFWTMKIFVYSLINIQNSMYRCLHELVCPTCPSPSRLIFKYVSK